MYEIRHVRIKNLEELKEFEAKEQEDNRDTEVEIIYEDIMLKEVICITLGTNVKIRSREQDKMKLNKERTEYAVNKLLEDKDLKLSNIGIKYDDIRGYSGNIKGDVEIIFVYDLEMIEKPKYFNLNLKFYDETDEK